MLGLAALVDAADVVGVAVLFQRRLYDLAHQLPVVQVLVLQVAGVNVGVLVHVLAVVDDLGEGAAGDFVVIVEIIQGTRIFCTRQVKFCRLGSTIVIAIDDGRVAFAKVGGTVCIVADAVGRNLLVLIFVRDVVVRSNFGCGTDRRGGAFSINVCVDNGIASAAVDVDVTSTATLRIYSSANCRVVVTGSIKIRRILRIVGAKGIDRIYGAAGNVDGCCTVSTDTISDCGSIRGADGSNVGILFNIDREIRTAAIPTTTNGAAS